ncbi:MAG: ATP-binding protein [Myxococcales bacterium]|nr:ATP-binding protein [Myxococcales bacterium]
MQELLDLVLASLDDQLPDDPMATYRRLRDEASDVDRSLLKVADRLALDAADVLMARLAMAVEEDLSIHQRVVELQPDGESRPTVGLLGRILAPFGQQGPAAVARSAALEVGLVALGSPELPLVRRSVAMPIAVLQALRGHDRDASRPGWMTLGEELEAQAARHGTAIAESTNVLVVRSPHLAEAKAAASAVAKAAERGTLWVDANPVGVPVRCVLANAWPVLTAQAGPDAHTLVERLPRWREPVLVVAGVDGAVEGAGGHPLLTWRVPVPSAQSRAQLWRNLLRDRADAVELGSAYRHRAGRIHDLAGLARTAARVEGRDKPSAADVKEVAREGHEALGRLAQLLPDPVSDEALVLAPAVRSDLESFLTRAKHREKLVEKLGTAAQARYATGLRALLVGPSGTGKTMAASWLATKLGLPLFRVDLAAVVGRTIGQTEQNLSELLSRAEASEVLLFFDEADSMFAKRTDVKQGTDRFANAQTNFLHQRIETYEGIVVLASNSRGRFDSAFSRRLDLIVQFPHPAPTERLELWKAHLGEHGVSAQELNVLAASCDLPGGHVRNAVMAGTVRAHDAGRTVSFDDLVEGLRMEYRKLGKAIPSALLKSRRANGAAADSVS